MPNLITRPTSATPPAAGDFIHFIDISDTTDDPAGSDKKVTMSVFSSGIAAWTDDGTDVKTTNAPRNVDFQGGGLKDTNVVSAIAFGQAVTGTALDGAFTATSVIGALNELKVGATKTAFFDPQYSGNQGALRIRSVASNGAFDYTFLVPDDFNALVSLRAIFVNVSATPTATANLDLFSDYGADTETFNNHSESDTTSTFPIPAVNILGFVDISGVFSVLAAGDRCGIEIDHVGIGGSLGYLQIELQYT